jgi:DNA mismatch endonuclease (patch repair protein)
VEHPGQEFALANPDLNSLTYLFLVGHSLAPDYFGTPFCGIDHKQATDCARPEVKKPRRHKGDFISAETRSAVMARIRGKETGPELALARELTAMGLEWEGHSKDLPGRPDFVFRDEKVAVLVDGDFWHGYRFSEWRDKLSEAWEEKIAGNVRRDIRNRAALRQLGWEVVRIWEHQIAARPRASAARVQRALERRKRS